MDFGTFFGPLAVAVVVAAFVSLVAGGLVTILAGVAVFLAGFVYSLTVGT